MTVNNRPGQLVGRYADPSMILDGIGDPNDETRIYACDERNRPMSDRIARPLLVAVYGLGGICFVSFATDVLGLAFSRAVGNAIRLFTMVPVTAAMGLVAIIKARSFDRECDSRRFLVRKGSHVVYMRSYLTLRATKGDPKPVVCLSIVHAIIYKGTATKDIGGARLSCAGTYQMEVSPDKAERAVIHTDSFHGEGEVVIPDCFEIPLQEVLGEWLEEEPWAWLMPLTPKDAVSVSHAKKPTDEEPASDTETDEDIEAGGDTSNKKRSFWKRKSPNDEKPDKSSASKKRHLGHRHSCSAV